MMHRSEKGSILVFAAVGLGVFLILAALVLDFGRMWIIAAQLQTAADASALAGASAVYCRMQVDGLGHVYSTEFFMDPSEAEKQAKTVLNANLANMKGYVPNSTVVTVYPSLLSVTVSVNGQGSGVLLSAAGVSNLVSIGRNASAKFVVPPIGP